MAGDNSETNVKSIADKVGGLFPRIFYFMVPVLSVILTLLVVEVGFAIFSPVPYSIEKNMYFMPDPYTGFKLAPNSVGSFGGHIPAATNKHGHRDDEVPLEKEEGAFRILLIGDSFSVGANVRQEEAYPQVLEELLDERSNEKIEIVNAACGGWNPFQYAQYCEYYGWKFDPGMILVGFFVGNDAFNKHNHADQLRTAVLGRRIRKKEAEGRFIKLKVFLYEYSNIARLILNKGPVSNRKKRKDCEDFTRHYIEIQKLRLPTYLKRDEKRYERAKNSIYQITRIKRAAQERSIPLAVVLIPGETQINPALQKVLISDGERDLYDFQMPQSMLIEMFAEKDIKTINLLPEFLKDPRCLYMNDTHWTPEGHKLAADFILRELDGIIPAATKMPVD